MTPQEIFEYKLSWLKTAVCVSFDESLEYEAKRWCRKNLKQQCWDFTSYTDVYEHAIFFENIEYAEMFQQWLHIERE